MSRLSRFYTGKTLKQSALFHFGAHRVTEHLPGWFERYNGRQTIEAGIKESKQVFSLHHLKVRSEPAIYLQEAFVLFAANFIRWAARLFASPGAPGRKRTERAQARCQTPGASGGPCLGAGDPGFRGEVVTVQRAERLCGPGTQPSRRSSIAAARKKLKIDAIFQRIASDCTTVTLEGVGGMRYEDPQDRSRGCHRK
jgi:hypothetical protein